MRFLVAILACAGLLAAPVPAGAEPVQSTTSSYASLRYCTAGETACESIGRSQHRSVGGTPGGAEARASVQHPDFGEVDGGVQLSGEPGAATLRAQSKALEGARNASSSFLVQRYANDSEGVQSLTLTAALSYQQTVPAENAGFPPEGGGQTAASVEMEFFSMDDEFIEAGSSAEENWNVLDGEPPAGYQSLDSADTRGLTPTTTGQGSEELSMSITLEPGDSAWLVVILQGIAANGATVEARLDTRLSISAD